MPEEITSNAVQEQQLIRHSVSYLQKYMHETYGNVKSWTPALVQSSLATLEGLEAVNSITGQIESVSQPLITSLDQRLDVVMQNLGVADLTAEDLQLSNLKTKAEKLTADLKTGIETRAETIKSEIGAKAADIKSGIETRAADIKTDLETRAESIKSKAEPLYTKALELKTDLETRASAIKTELDTKAVHWKSVRGDISKKTIQRLENGFTTMKQFSSDQSKAYLHIDLIQYATEVIDNAQSTVKPTFDVLNEKIASGILTVTNSISSIQEVAVQKSRTSIEQAEAFRSELRARLAKAIAASRELSLHSAEYVIIRYRKIQNLDREQIQATFNDSIQYILESPQLFTKLTQRLNEQLAGADVSSIGAIEHINRLLTSIQEVFVPKKSTLTKTTATDKVEEPVEETKESKRQESE
jgi:hypothetical protein